MSTKLPSVVRELLVDRVDSFEKLEVIVALRATPSATISVDELARSLTLSREAVREAAIALRSASLVELTLQGEVRLLPPDARDQAAVDELARVYREDRFTVVQMMGELAVARIRNMTTRAFADAFVIRKRGKKEGQDG